MPAGGHLSREVLDEVLGALGPGERLAPREVYARVRKGSPVTVRHALRELCLEGSVAYVGPDGARLYYRARSSRAVTAGDAAARRA